MKKYSVRIAGHPTSITLEPPFWQALSDIAHEKNTSAGALISEIDERRGSASLSGAIRVFILEYYKDRA